MDNVSTSTDLTQTFSDSNYSESDYLQLARAYRNEAAGAVFAVMFRAVSTFLKEKLSFDWQALLKRA
jgi:hypothetical protein